ncbi:MAG: glutamate-cysteine ligase family protein, partial [Actinomycetota bacterium]
MVTIAGDRRLDADLADHLASQSFACTSELDRVGLELEWLVYDRSDLDRRIGPDDLVALAERGGPVAPGVTCSPEPGGQVELDTPPTVLEDGVALARAGSSVLHRRLRDEGLTPVAVGVDPHRRPHNLLDVPRYRAMEATFAARGPDGVAMMANTAAMQVNIDLDPDGERWRLVHQLGPLLVAAFANSPVGPDGGTTHKSHRLDIWSRIDPSRTAPVPHDGDPARAWLRYALDANVLLIRREGAATAVE